MILTREEVVMCALANVPPDLRFRDLGLSRTTRLLLHFDGIFSVEELVANTGGELLSQTMGIDEERLKEIEAALTRYGLWLYRR